MEPWTQKRLVPQNHAPLADVRCRYSSIVGCFGSFKGREGTKECNRNIGEDIVENVNSIGAGRKNLKAAATRDLAEAKKPKTGNKPLKRGEYTDLILDIVGDDRSEALDGTDGADGQR